MIFLPIQKQENVLEKETAFKKTTIEGKAGGKRSKEKRKYWISVDLKKERNYKEKWSRERIMVKKVLLRAVYKQIQH